MAQGTNIITTPPAPAFLKNIYPCLIPSNTYKQLLFRACLLHSPGRLVEYFNLHFFFFFYKKPRVRGSGLAFLRIPEFESQKFLRLIKIPVFSFLTFSCFEPLIFLRSYTKNTSRTIILDFWSKELSFCIKC